MKQIINLLVLNCLFFLAISSVSCQSKDYNLSLTAELKGSYRFSDSGSHYYFLADIKLINNTDSVCKFIAFNCLTNMNLLTNSEHVSICSNDCAGNFPTLIIIQPKQEFLLPVILSTKSDSPVLNCPIRIGFVFVKEKPTQNLLELLFKMKENNESILWSEPFILQVAGGKPFSVF